VLAEVLALVLEKQLGVATKVKNLELVDFIRLVLKVVKCLFTDNIDLLVLKSAKLISDNAKTAKVYLSGEVKRKLTIQGLLLTKGARAAIEAAGGKVVEV
jgi:large subunit ribosomal protein L15